MLTQEKLKELLHYNPKTGVFTWKISRGNKKIGQVAGTLNGGGYTTIKVFKKLFYAHRLAWLYMTSEWPKKHIDHINGVKGDNKWSNLREATRTQNMQNMGSKHNSSSSYKGVSWSKKTSKWVSRIRLNGKNKYLGTFDCEHEAALVYNQFALKHHGGYARLNQVYSHFDVEVGRGD